MRIGIVGAGIAGLSAGRYLQSVGHDVVLFEKSRGPGGRVATRRQDGYSWDTGATSIAPRGKSIEAVLLRELPREDLVKIQGEIYIHHGLRVGPGDRRASVDRYTYRTGINTLPKLLARSLDVRLSAPVEGLTKTEAGYRIGDEEFDAIILTPPIPQTAAIMWSLGESRAFASVRYRTCLSVYLGFATPLPETPYHAILDPEQRHPLTWLSLESTKCPGSAPEGCSSLVAQLSAAYSFEHYETPKDQLISAVCGYLERIYGPAFRTPLIADVMRWKYSQPEALASLYNVNPPGSRLLIASDALLGGRIEDAFEVGLLVAKQLNEELKS